jgi:hypothetical protein
MQMKDMVHACVQNKLFQDEKCYKEAIYTMKSWKVFVEIASERQMKHDIWKNFYKPHILTCHSS